MKWLERVLVLTGVAIGLFAGLALSLALILLVVTVVTPNGTEEPATGLLIFFYPMALALGPLGGWFGAKVPKAILKRSGGQT